MARTHKCPLQFVVSVPGGGWRSHFNKSVGRGGDGEFK